MKPTDTKKILINSICFHKAFVIFFNHIPVPAKTSAPFDFANVLKHPSFLALAAKYLFNPTRFFILGNELNFH